LRRTRLSLAAALALATSVGLVAVPSVASAKPKPNIPVQLIAMNDFHGRISTQAGSDGQLLSGLGGPGPDGKPGTTDDGTILVGGAAHVSATVQALRASFAEQNGGSTDSFFVGAGDLISASPFESSVFKDEPTIEVLDAMGLDVSSVGNHEFDRGTDELRRISGATDDTYTDDVEACEGIIPNQTGCFGDGDHAFDGADFPYLAANVLDKATGQPMLPPYQVFDVAGGQKVALIGVVTETTPTIVSPTGITDVSFVDEAEAVNHWTRELKKQGIRSVGVLVHEGGDVTGTASIPTANDCTGLTGPIVDLNDRMDKGVDFIVSAHAHETYNCLLPVRGSESRLVTQAGFYGKLVTDVRLTINPNTGDVDRRATYTASNVAVTRNSIDPQVQAIVDYWNSRAAGPGNVVVGTVDGPLLRARDGESVVRYDESVLGTFVANAQLAVAQTRPELQSPAVAFMNPGGLRTDIAAGEVTFRELFDVQPFSNTVNTITLTGAAIDDVLEQQFRGADRASDLVLSTSDGFRYEYDRARSEGDRVFDCSVTINGAPIEPTATYRVAANSFLAGGGDSFTAFTTGTGQVTGPVDVDTSVEYLRGKTLTPPTGDHAIPTATPTCAP
jgi:5'-nucleotidase